MSVESTVVELRQLLAALVAEAVYDQGWCAYCQKDPGHAEDCPWAVARAYLYGDAGA